MVKVCGGECSEAVRRNYAIGCAVTVLRLRWGYNMAVVKGTRRTLQKLLSVTFTTHDQEGEAGETDMSRREREMKKTPTKNIPTQVRWSVITCIITCNYLHVNPSL